MKKFTLIVLFFLLTFTSCNLFYHYVPFYVRHKSFTLRFTENSSGLKDKLNINGYYYFIDSLKLEKPLAVFRTIMFFDDGMFALDFNHERIENINELGNYIEKVIDAEENSILKQTFYRHLWGYYKIENNIIKAQFIEKPNFGDMDPRLYAYELLFEIVDSNTIKQIESYPIHKTSKFEFSYFKEFSDSWNGIESNFIALKRVPNSDSWLKHEKWFWEDKAKYRQWTKKHNK